jgi:hypothetical protein
MFLSTEERVFLVEYVFREGNRYTDLVQEQFAEKFPQTPVPHRSAVRRLIEKFRGTGSVLDAERSGRPSKLNDKKLMDISDSMLRSPSKSLRKLAQEKNIGLATAITAYVRNISQADLQKVSANKIKRVQACIDARGHHFQHLLKVQSDFPNALYNQQCTQFLETLIYVLKCAFVHQPSIRDHIKLL